MQTLVSKLESDGRDVMEKLEVKMKQVRAYRNTNESLLKEKEFLEKTVKKEKKQVLQQEKLLLTLSRRFEELNALLKFKENEIMDLEVKLMRYEAFASKSRSPMTNNELTSPATPNEVGNQN